MLISFTCRNFRSFRDTTVFSMVPVARLREKGATGESAVHQEPTGPLLKVAAILGANASGKSNFLKALAFYRQFIFDSVQVAENQEINCTPFLFDDQSGSSPVYFEATLAIKGVTYTYGYEITRKQVVGEWLRRREKKEVVVFTRREQNFQIRKSSGTLNFLFREQMIRPMALFLPLGAQFNDPVCTEVLEWFRNMNSLSGLHDLFYRNYTFQLMKDPGFKSRVDELLQKADTGIEGTGFIETDGFTVGVNFNGMNPDDLRVVKEKSTITQLTATHRSFDLKGQLIDSRELPFQEESAGTHKYLNLLGPILDALDHGKVLIIDELETSLHPLLVMELIHLFNSASNKTGAQLLFTTQNTALLDAGVLRRDQIWLVEKNRYGVSNLYSLSDFKKAPRNDAALEKNYLEGRYGGVPYLADLKAAYEAK